MSRLFLVDDHTIVRDGLRAMLQGGGHEVVGEATEPTAALAGILGTKPELLVLDLGLQDRSGLELLDTLRRRELAVPTLVLTMSVQPHDVAEALRLGAGGYLRKDASREELLQAVRTVAAGGRHVGADLASAAASADTRPEAERLERLSPRERQIIALVARGQSSTSIGTHLHLSPKTVDTYRSRLMAKLGLADVTSLVRFAVRHGLVDVDA